MHYFATQLHAEQQTTRSLRASQYARKRQHKRHDAGGEDEEEEPPTSPEPQPRTRSTRSASSTAQSYSSLITPELAQLRTAGLLPEEEYEIPPSPFPHAPARTSRDHYGAKKVEREIAGLPSRLYAVKPPLNAISASESTTLKTTHLNVLSAVMHRCLLEGDYDRAGRAWGMILRTEVAGGRPIEARNHGRWGIGAEILLHQKRGEPLADNSDQQSGDPSPDSMYSEEGFERAREYYERLIVQYPHRRAPRNAADEKTFYPAMFSLWIFEVCEKSRRARRKFHAESRSRDMSIDSVMGVHDEISPAQEDEIQVAELARAMEIADRLDQLVASPPFDKQASLLHLRGNIALWISDLIIGKTDADADEDWDMDADHENHEGHSDLSTEDLTRLTNGRKELLKAQTFLQRAEANGGLRQAGTKSSIDIKLRELARQFARYPALHES
ncbi:hypothetical protein P153DRAFT_390011 [Dothidotthia symphoricarpi CBS 119687]|uniref:RNA polymerase I-specific transcription initiation factor rrn11 n=1 Tax=Dothidotthia symphoricarpi CBS 119687 TaxID=1392245 RepID=A0A6A6A0V5_9PLEO|nr:uncharacterized protein P153DRAFT_390011 [Dothidotthia symphoricarpi CBS 119687]KAF2125166.1 hypothetical protein P153DRAFT_390011 [Dothidotthia symphoricarpi CBS 119687]